MMEAGKYRQCVRCVMDTSDPDISFNEAGQCNHCCDFLTMLDNRPDKDDSAARKTLERLVQKIKKAGNGLPYDCILGVSGGVDSSYTAWLLKKLDIRTLLVHMDNGWNAEEAVLNIRHLAECLGFDYESVVLDWEEFKDLQLAFLKASVIEADTPTDIAILGALHKVAAENGVKYIISGGNLATEGILPRFWHYDAKDTRYIKAIHALFGTGGLHKFPFFGFLREAYFKLIKGVKIVYLLNHVNFDKEEAMNLLKRELNWKYYGGKHHESRYTKFVQSYLLPVKFGIEYRKATFSSQICTGKMTREQAMIALLQPPYDQEKIGGELDYVAKKLGIQRAELDDIIALPPKTYRDYPNNEKKLTSLYHLYRKLFTVILCCFGTGNMFLFNAIPEVIS